MKLHHIIRRYIGYRIQCQTVYGTFHGVVVHCTNRHIILAVSPPLRVSDGSGPVPAGARPFFPGPGGPGWGGPGSGWGGPGWGGGPGGPGWGGPGGGPGGPGWGGGPGGGPGGGWKMAIPLVAILGITALGLHW